jgi:holdfast attachment protein HfaB
MYVTQKKKSVLPLLRLWLGLPLTAMLSACGTLPSFNTPNYIAPLNGASVVANTTDYTKSLDCLGEHLKKNNSQPLRFAVGRVDDYSGKQDLVNGRRMTQGAALMVISALSRTHLPIVERLDVSTAEMELKYTDNKLIGDNSLHLPEGTASSGNTFRRTFAGSVIGSDYHIIGGITEVNYNIRSGNLDGTISKFGASGRYAVLDVAMDLRLVNTKTLEIADVVSFKKQIIGTEIRAGFFSFFSDNNRVIDVSASDKAQEPIQLAVRMISERAVFELVSNLYKLPDGVCSKSSTTSTRSSDSNDTHQLSKNKDALPNDWNEYTKWASNH